MTFGRIAGVLIALVLVAVPTQACAYDGPEQFDHARAVLTSFTTSLERRAAGDLTGAIAAIEEARRLAPLDPELALEAARMYAVARQYGAAALAYTDATTLSPRSVEAFLEKARFHLAGGFRVEQAVIAAREATRLDPENLVARATLAAARVIAIAAGKYEYLDASPGRSYNSPTEQANGNGGTIYGGRGSCCNRHQLSE
ncbi:MAG: hypothetical protein EPO26_06380 [Chloroflexota bacterium]|nr:MAG: hypothetical protein EPO26_06380 [Chloroflexota bacterium]